MNTGIYVFSPAIFAHIPANEFYDFGKQVFPALQTAERAVLWFRSARRLLGRHRYARRISPRQLRRAARRDNDPWDARPPGSIRRPRSEARFASKVPFGSAPDARVGDGVTIVGPSIVGERAAIEPGARLERAILWEGAQIGAGAGLLDTVVGANYAVLPGAKIDNALVATDE